jgi:uncharacterized protein
MLYIDTSVLVAALTAEAMTAQAQGWLAAQAVTDLVVSEWTLTEVSSALSVKVRTRAISQAERALVMATFNRWVADSLTVLPVTGAHFRTAARFVDQPALGLRAGDALHLAVAADCGATLHTLDVRLADAGPQLGVPTHRLA